CGDRGSLGGTELDSDLRLGFQSGRADELDQSQEVFRRYRDKAAGDFDDVKAQLSAFAHVAVDVLRAIGQHALDEPSGRDQNVMFVAEVYQLLDRPARHE